MTRPRFHKTRKIMQTAAVGRRGGGHIARQKSGVNRRANGLSAGKRGLAVTVLPVAREDGDRVGGNGSGQGASGVGGALGGGWDVVVAQDISRRVSGHRQPQRR